MRKEPRLSTVGFDTWHEFGDLMTHRIIGWYDDISREFCDMLAHRMILAMW